MKVLYAALRHDPGNPDLASGVDHNFYTAFLREGMEVRVVGPFVDPPPLFERVLKKLYIAASGKRYLKWDLQSVWRSSQALNQFEKSWHPDIVFSIFPAPLAFYTGNAPCIFNTDTTFQGWQEGGAGFGDLALRTLVWIERRAIRRSAKIIAFSDWCKREIIKRHGVDAHKIEVCPMPSALPTHVVPRNFESIGIKKLTQPLKLLLVSRDYHRKGVDIGIEIVKGLNSNGIAAELTVCGIKGKANCRFVQFVGPYRKSDPTQLQQYVELYRQAHFLIHPARFDPSPIVPAEAAAFGVPTITNDAGGIATSAKDGVSGVVLPKHSAPEAYVKVIQGLLKNPERYNELCRTARERYENEQNWEVAGKRIVQILKEVAQVLHSR